MYFLLMPEGKGTSFKHKSQTLKVTRKKNPFQINLQIFLSQKCTENLVNPQ